MLGVPITKKENCSLSAEKHKELLGENDMPIVIKAKNIKAWTRCSVLNNQALENWMQHFLFLP